MTSPKLCLVVILVEAGSDIESYKLMDTPKLPVHRSAALKERMEMRPNSTGVKHSVVATSISITLGISKHGCRHSLDL